MVSRALPHAAAALFQRMALRDQRHSLDVWQRVQQATADAASSPDLLAAALLHDVAKTTLPGRRLRLGHRVAIVLLDALSPGAVERLASDRPGSWRYPFYVHRHHPQLGARLAQDAGCSPLTVELIRRHQTKLRAAPHTETERLLAVLQAADDAS